MDAALLRPRIAAPIGWLAEQAPDGRDRRRLIESCRAELVWARADWLETTAGRDGWQEACLPHEQAAARLLEIWGLLHPLEHRLGETIGRLRAQRCAGWDVAATLEDVRGYRRDRRVLWRAFRDAACDYGDQRAELGWTVSASGCVFQNARTVSNLWRRAS